MFVVVKITPMIFISFRFMLIAPTKANTEPRVAAVAPRHSERKKRLTSPYFFSSEQGKKKRGLSFTRVMRKHKLMAMCAEECTRGSIRNDPLAIRSPLLIKCTASNQGVSALYHLKSDEMGALASSAFIF